ncbi:olfactomedin-4 [Amia ocellicauda]|uniref:olfactomedin-4 n=1 Tax=Amia ocellicauda TaxID=2972642 RepID=UPI00346390F6
MVPALLLFALLRSTLAWVPIDHWGSGNVTAGADENGQCVCKVFLPDTSFPGDKVELLQKTSMELSQKVELGLSKLELYESKLVIYAQKLVNLTVRVEIMQGRPDQYTELEFELLRIELQQMEALVTQLRQSVNSSSPIFDLLYVEIQNMTSVVNQLERYDKNNLLVMQHEFTKLQKKLEDCQKWHDESFKPDIGSCNHGGISNISMPYIVQLGAHVNEGYLYGGWGRDSKPKPGFEDMYWYSGYTSPYTYNLYLYSDYTNLLLRNQFKYFDNTLKGNGINNIMHGNYYYYNCYNTGNLCRMNATTFVVETRVLPDAAWNNRFSYSSATYQDFDFAADENGLWVIYATEASKGNMVLSKMNVDAFSAQQTWVTNVFRRRVSNAFMVCGVLYATRQINLNIEEIFYKYDTKTGKESYISIPFNKQYEGFVYLDYNPADQRLYMYSKGYYIYYNVKFEKI